MRKYGWKSAGNSGGEPRRAFVCFLWEVGRQQSANTKSEVNQIVNVYVSRDIQNSS